jgi:hypothetical protein
MLKENKKIIYEKDNQLEEKEEEIKRLKNEIIQEKEENKEDDVSSKHLADLKELWESYVNIKIKLEESKRREEVVRNQLDKKEESCHKMEAKVVNLRKKVENLDTQIKFLNNSITLDEILDSRRSLYDKTGLVHNKEEISNLKKPDVSPSFVKSEDRFDASLSFIKREESMMWVLHVQRIKETLQNLEYQIKEDIQKLLIHLKASSEERHLHG